MISCRPFWYSAMIRRASSEREGRLLNVCCHQDRTLRCDRREHQRHQFVAAPGPFSKMVAEATAGRSAGVLGHT